MFMNRYNVHFCLSHRVAGQLTQLDKSETNPACNAGDDGRGSQVCVNINVLLSAALQKVQQMGFHSSQ